MVVVALGDGGTDIVGDIHVDIFRLVWRSGVVHQEHRPLCNRCFEAELGARVVVIYHTSRLPPFVGLFPSASSYQRLPLPPELFC